MSKKCIWCGGMAVYLGFAGIRYYCPHCEGTLTDDEVINDMTVFEHITESPETLAEKLVYIDGAQRVFNTIWRSTLLPNKYWKTEAEAHVATVVKLKEVVKDDR